MMLRSPLISLTNIFAFGFGEDLPFFVVRRRNLRYLLRDLVDLLQPCRYAVSWSGRYFLFSCDCFPFLGK